jgi:septal ring factor EnvC (AmiA/AmiB activator)
MQSKQMFGKTDLIDSLRRDLARTREKRDTLAAEVATLTEEIAVLETRLSAENDRRELERAASGIERIKKHLNDQHLAFAPVVTGIREATEMAVAIVPEARELGELLQVVATEVANAIDGLVGDLDGRIEALRAGHVAPDLPPTLSKSAQTPQDNARVLRLPEWLPRIRPTKKESVEDRCRTAAA